jgi:hypothetical protein
MTDKIINLFGSEHLPEETLDDRVEDAWLAAVTEAMSDGAVFGALLYVAADGELYRIPIGADRASFRGLIEETLDDLRLSARGG